MLTFEIECVDTATFQVYKTSVTAGSIDEARQEAVRNGHKLAVPAQSLNPQLVPASVQMNLPGSTNQETRGNSQADQIRRSNIRMLIFITIVLVIAGVALAMRMLR